MLIAIAYKAVIMLPASHSRCSSYVPVVVGAERGDIRPFTACERSWLIGLPSCACYAHQLVRFRCQKPELLII